MRRGRRWISSQCNYFLGRETNRRDHCALVAVIYAEGWGGGFKRYCRQTQRSPISSLPRGSQTQIDAGYKELLQDKGPPPWERSANKWITNATWQLLNYCAILHRKGMISQAAACNLRRKINASLKADCLKHAMTTASNVKGCLVAGEFVEAWRHIKG